MAYTKKYLPINSDIKEEWDAQEDRVASEFELKDDKALAENRRFIEGGDTVKSRGVITSNAGFNEALQTGAYKVDIGGEYSELLVFKISGNLSTIQFRSYIFEPKLEVRIRTTTVWSSWVRLI